MWRWLSVHTLTHSRYSGLRHGPLLRWMAGPGDLGTSHWENQDQFSRKWFFILHEAKHSDTKRLCIYYNARSHWQLYSCTSPLLPFPVIDTWWAADWQQPTIILWFCHIDTFTAGERSLVNADHWNIISHFKPPANECLMAVQDWDSVNLKAFQPDPPSHKPQTLD